VANFSGKLPEDEAAVRIVIHKNVNFKTLMNSPVAPKEEISTTVPLDMGL
jgi:hypothetical protein